MGVTSVCFGPILSLQSGKWPKRAGPRAQNHGGLEGGSSRGHGAKGLDPSDSQRLESLGCRRKNDPGVKVCAQHSSRDSAVDKSAL